MHDTTRRLLTVLRELQIDGLLEAVYNCTPYNDIEDLGGDGPPLEEAVYAWAAAGYPDDAQSSPILSEIAAERGRQIAKGYDAAHDDQHTDGELATAAGLIALSDYDLIVDDGPADTLAAVVLDRHDDERERLIIAAAMIVAEIERLDRASTLAAPK